MRTTTPHGPSGRVTLVAVSEPRTTDGGRPFFVARFKRVVLGRPVSRTYWAPTTTAPSPWDRLSLDDLRPLTGEDLSGEVEVVPVEIEPERFVGEDGLVHTVTTRTVVRFADEPLVQACRWCGSVLAAERYAAPATDPWTCSLVSRWTYVREKAWRAKASRTHGRCGGWWA